MHIDHLCDDLAMIITSCGKHFSCVLDVHAIHKIDSEKDSFHLLDIIACLNRSLTPLDMV